MLRATLTELSGSERVNGVAQRVGNRSAAKEANWRGLLVGMARRRRPSFAPDLPSRSRGSAEVGGAFVSQKTALTPDVWDPGGAASLPSLRKNGNV